MRIIGLGVIPMGATIKNIQEGTISIVGANSTNTVTITGVDLTKAFLLFMGETGVESYLIYGMARLSFDSATVVRATRAQGYVGYDMVINFMVVEFSNGIKSIQSGIVTIADGSTSGDTTVTAVDLGKSLLCYLGSISWGTAMRTLEHWGRIKRLNSTTIRAERTDTDGVTVVGFQLVEFL